MNKSKQISSYFLNKNKLSMPWIKSPFFSELIKNSNYNNNEIKKLKKFNKDGYLIIDLQLDNNEIDNIVSDMYKLTNKAMSKYDNSRSKYL